MKKRYSLKFEGEQHNSVVAMRGDEIAIQCCDDCELNPVSYHSVLGGKAVSLGIDGQMHLIHVTGLDNNGNLALTLNGRSVQVNVMDELKAQALESLGGAEGSGTIAADIPGLVVDIRVQKGQRVEAGEPVIVVEAMKMQNELTAAIGGVVSEIPVSEGQTVNPGDPLVVIEPDPVE